LPEQQRTNSDGTPVNPATYGQGLLMAGAPGTGKTTLATALACDVRRQRQSVYMIRYPEYVDRERYIAAGRDDDEAHLARCHASISRVADAHLVVLDDVGHEHLTASRFAEDTLAAILRNRFSAGRPTIITTNLTGDHWRNRYSPALRSFVAEATRLIAFLGPDLRGGHAAR
jgi:DNA replication protein DnaC